jgi:uncharacterized protein (TIGR00251 family)
MIAVRCQLAIKVVPGASRNGIAGWLGDALKVRVAAPPERGKANAAVEQLLAEAIGIAAESVRIVAGATSARKTVEITGVSLDEVRARLARPTQRKR